MLKMQGWFNIRKYDITDNGCVSTVIRKEEKQSP